MGSRLVWVGILFLPFALMAQADRKRVRVGGGYSVPWAYLAPDGTPTGLYVEVMREAARREGLEFEIVFRNDGPEKALRSGAIDIWSAAVATDERRKSLYFTEPWWTQDHYLGVMASSSIYGVNDLAAKSVVYATTPPFTASLPVALPGAKLQPLNDLRARFHAVCDGRADAVLFYHETSLFSVTGSNEFADCRARGLRLIPLGRTVMETSIAALPENKKLADRMRRRIEEMRADQTLARFADSPLTGTQTLSQMLREERTQNQQRMLQITVIFLSLVLLLGGVAYVRLRNANRRTRAALAAAERASRVKSEFLATMSHEIRTPLTAIIGYMEMLIGTPLRHDQRRYATEVKQATASLLTLMASILGYARPVPLVSAEGETLDAPGVFDECVATVLLDAENKGLELSVEISPNVPRHLYGDSVPLRQSVLNLLANAVKFTSHGWVHVEASYADQHLTCIVSDSGQGIPAERRKDIFEPFTQLDSTDKRRFGGVGLGLAVVADLCKQLGGTVRVDDALGGGAQFTIRVPYQAAGAAAGWLAPAVQGTAVLLAEESRAIHICCSYLRAAGLEVVLLRTAEDLQNWVPPEGGRIFCFIDGARFGTTAPAWRNSRTVLVLLGSLTYLRSVPEDRKLRFDDILPLPVAARSLAELLHPLPVSSVSAAKLGAVAVQVLVVDDNAVNRRVLTSLLEKLGARVETAQNGREAVEAVLRQRFHLVFMDCQMPVMNGYEAATEIRRHPTPVGDVPICGISASLDGETRIRCQESGMDEYLPKPVTLDMLRDLLTRVAARHIIVENL